MLKEYKKDPINISFEEKYKIANDIAYEMERQLENSMNSTAQYMEKVFIKELINELKK